MNAFTVAGLALVLAIAPLLAVAAAARPIDGVAALELAGTLGVLVFLCLGEGFHRSFSFDVPVIAALAFWIGGLVFVRFAGRFL